jgi:DNA-binding LacI/PurR family transcriptional regulator
MAPRSTLYWVSGFEVTSGDISSYYTELLAACSRESGAMGFSISAHWIPVSKSSIQPRPWESADHAVGFLFSAIDESHQAMTWALTNNVPFVNFVGAIQSAPWTVTPDWEECGKLAGQWLADQGIKDCLVVSNLPNATFHVPEGSGMEVQELVIKPGDGRKSTVEREAYRIGRHLIREGKIPQGIYITDDIIARGFTRALLHDTVLAQSVKIVVRGFREQVIPLGLDAAFVTWRVADQARMGLELLLSRIQHRETAINATVHCELIEPEFWSDGLALQDHELPMLGQSRTLAGLAAH